ncbi:hypothetical protein CQ046_20675 [Chryseobacterium sp. MYb7]|uniref:hypothetical protein n=1 Tax=Chryseobacterium sp. MYb7 TaxID=1827290 RepID=UPI000D00DCD5|nr:hypothetical protein [Chryseobacterium sp. MYb7]PRA97660.1 hypothetical protein CQ046_20675 [Chryseobacterium sp. MYb7]
MSKIFFILLLTTPLLIFSQIGIQTATPKNTLHVNGSLQIVKDLNVGGDGSTAGSSGNAGDFLRSNGPGKAPEWKPLSSQKMVFIADKTNTDPSTITFYLANSTHNIRYNSVRKIFDSYITYDSNTGIFTVKKSGFYSITTYLTYDLSANPLNETNGMAISIIDKIGDVVKVSALSTNYSERTDTIFHSLTGIRQFDVGETFTVHCNYTKQYRLSTANISVLYISE